MSPLRARTSVPLALLLVVTSCAEKGAGISDSARSTPADSGASSPVNATNWDMDAGPVMVMSLADGESVSIVLPQATDSTFPSGDSLAIPSDLRVDLFGRAGKIASNVVVSPLTRTGAAGCQSWPAARTKTALPGWRVGFPVGRVEAVALDSLAGMSSADSAVLAKQIVQAVSSLPLASDSEFRGLPFHVRSAYTFRYDATAGVIADVVRSVNEEANPRLEHLFVVSERPVNSTSGYKAGFFSRTAGREEEADITELLAVVLIGPARRPAIVVNVDYDEGGKPGLLQRTAPGQWRFRWRGAYTGC